MEKLIEPLKEQLEIENESEERTILAQELGLKKQIKIYDVKNC